MSVNRREQLPTMLRRVRGWPGWRNPGQRTAARRLLLGLLAIAVVPVLTLIGLAVVTPLPAALREDHRFDASVRVLDRNGVVLAEVRADDGARARWAPLNQVPAHVQAAVLAAEDRRFYEHPGVDPIAIVRAAGQNLLHLRIVSGASTLTQQLARNVVPRPRTLLGKIKEMALALRIEASLSKSQILEQYLNVVTFGPSLRGIESASRFYFDKPCSALSLSEAALLASMPRGPSVYDPRRSPRALQARRDRVLSRMLDKGWIDAESVERARGEPITLHTRATGFGAPHLVRGLLSGAVQRDLGPLTDKVSVLQTTLDAALQREVQTAARSLVGTLRGRHVSAASVVVLDNASGEVLAWLGAPDFLDDEHGGQNDGVLALRQPGSTLKPLLYGLAMEEMGWTASTLLPDIDLHFPAEQGDYSPHNYDGLQHGPVRLREALANSYNIPAVYTASVVGPDRVLDRLHAVGFQSLDREADWYGPAIALGDGEVRLIDLANAYATLARGGLALPVRALSFALDTKGQRIEPPPALARRVMAEPTSAVLLDILKDPHARLASFGAGSVLEFPFEVAVKTGTSKGFRDNLTVGVSSSVTVAVWVGNFDGTPMQQVSGITGAGPLFRAVMLAAAKVRPAEPFAAPSEPLERVEVCARSGKRPGPHCQHRVTETFVPGTAPDQTCEMHIEVLIDRRNGLRAGSGCPSAQVQPQVFESYEPRYTSWAVSTRRPLAPSQGSPLCPGANAWAPAGPRDSHDLAIRYPYRGAIFLLDPSLPPSAQGVVVRADAPSSVQRLRFFVDGTLRATRSAPFEQVWMLSLGHHRVWVEADGMGASQPVEFDVE